MAGIRLFPQNRGMRIRPYMRYLKRILFGVLVLTGLVPLIVFSWYEYDKLLSLDYLLIGLLVSLILFVILFGWYLSWFLPESTVLFAKLDRLERLARFLYENNFVYEKKAKDNRRIVKFPKIYMKQGKFDLAVSFELAGSKFQEKFKKIGGDLETTFSMDFMETEDDNRYKKYILAYSSLLNRLNGGEMKYIPSKGVELMKNFYWDFASDPHMLVVGGIGGGKTVLLRFLILCLSKVGVVDICDPKRADFVTMSDIPAFSGRISYDVESIIESVENALSVMEERFEFMRKEQKRLGHKDLLPFYEYGLEPYFWVCDELNAFKSMLNYRQVERFDNALGQIVLLGRQAGVNVILAMQKPSREDLGSKLQANINFRVAVGRLDEMGYELAFEEVNRNKEFKFMKYVGGMRVYGRGYAAVKGQVAREFYSPLLTKGFSFYDEFNKIQRREHKHREMEILEVETLEKEADSEELLDDGVLDCSSFSKKIGKTFNQVLKVVKECETKGYLSFEKKDGKYLLSAHEQEILTTLFEQKETTDFTWSVVIDNYFSDTEEVESFVL